MAQSLIGRCPASVELGGFFGATELSSSEAELSDMKELRPDIFRRLAGDRTESVSKWEFFLPM